MWKKLGKIFDPTQHSLSDECTEYAQSPQALVFDDFVRVYFSTRKKELGGKFLSYISFVDFDKDLNKILNISKETVVKLGELGCFDEHGIFPISPLKDGERIVAYTCGWSRRNSVSVETSTGLIQSSDGGVTFERVNGNGPIMSSSLHEPFLVGDAFVRKYHNRYHMWYIYGLRWIPNEKEGPARVYKIAYSISDDGINWSRSGIPIIPDLLNADECQALPTVIDYDNKYHMFFCYREATDFRRNKNRGYKLGYAYSADLQNWERDPNNDGLALSEEGWDSEMMCYPNVFCCNDKIYLLYNGNEFGRYGFGLAVLEK